MDLILVSSSCVLLSNLASAWQIEQYDASSFLSRERRDNRDFFEEAKQGDLERECIEEICSHEEVREALEDDGEADNWYNKQISMCGVDGNCNKQYTDKCVNTWGGFKCHCKPGMTGKDCEQDINECEQEGEYCKNGGACTNFMMGANCTCTDQFTGPTCSDDVDECKIAEEQGEDLCGPNGSCVNTNGGYTCSCNAGWTGEKCTEDQDECQGEGQAEGAAAVCGDYQKCRNTIGSYVCYCTGGKTGDMCEIDFDECAELNPCAVGSTCVNHENGYECVCSSEGCAADSQKVEQEIRDATTATPEDEEEDGSGSEVDAPEIDETGVENTTNWE